MTPQEVMANSIIYLKQLEIKLNRVTFDQIGQGDGVTKEKRKNPFLRLLREAEADKDGKKSWFCDQYHSSPIYITIQCEW